ncbi:MAG: N-acetylmuramoyl-L-alanine amidase [Acidobacteriaceae bacterium]
MGLTAAVFLSGQAIASSAHRESELAFARAETVRLHLEAKPAGARTRLDYERALNAYRVVYHGDPASPDAARSIAAVADLLEGEAHCFHDARLLHDAAGQWKFLRREYPGSPLRVRAALKEAEINHTDLQDRPADGKSERAAAVHASALKSAHTAVANARPVARKNMPNARPAAGESTVLAGSPATPRPVFPQSAVAGVAGTDAVLQPNPRPAQMRSAVAASASAVPPKIQAVRYWAAGKATRLAIDMSNAVPYHSYLARDGKQITLVFFGAHLSAPLLSHRIAVAHDTNLRSIRASVLSGDQAELTLTLTHPASFSSFVLSNPDRLILDIGAETRAAPKKHFAPMGARAPAIPLLPKPVTKTSVVAAVPPMVVPEMDVVADPGPTVSDGQHSMARVLGLRVRRIVIDAGHGGHDSGTLGPGGVEEKDVALDVALRLGSLLHRRLGADVIYTRRTDRFVALEERTAIANRAHADLFLSIHANSSSDPSVRGVETYFLNFTASPDALQVAARENAISNRSVHELSNLVREITLSDKIDESREFAADVQQSLYGGLSHGNPGFKNRGVKQAPFAVLIGANMPSILAEISFLTNPQDAADLTQPAYRERLAESLYRGVAQYVEGMSGVRVAKTAPPLPLLSPAE